MSEIKESTILLAMLVLAAFIAFIGCFAMFGGNEETLTPQQQECNHEWRNLTDDTETFMSFDGDYLSIYCPKCKLEKRVKRGEWKKIQIDQEYQKEHQEEGE